MRFAPLVLAAAVASSQAASAAEAKARPEPDTYIFDLLPLQPYKGSLARLVAGKDMPEWVKAISTKGEGTAVPSKTVDIAGTPYRLDHVCKPHDCAGNTLDVLWAPAGHRAWAALVEGGKAPVILGNPPSAQAKVLADVVAPGSAGVSAPAAQAAPADPTSPTARPAPAATPASAPSTGKPAPTASEPDTYIFDLLAMQPYKGNLARLTKSKGTPDWVKAITMKGEGTAVPAKTIDIAGAPYRLDHVCKPHDCLGNTLDVLWAPGGRKVWAALADGGKPPVMLGNPPAAEAKALTDAATPAAAATPFVTTPAR